PSSPTRRTQRSPTQTGSGAALHHIARTGSRLSDLRQSQIGDLYSLRHSWLATLALSLLAGVCEIVPAIVQTRYVYAEDETRRCPPSRSGSSDKVFPRLARSDLADRKLKPPAHNA